MTRTTLVAVAFAALLVTVGTVAAAPGNAPVDVGADDQYDDQAERTDDASGDDHAANESTAGDESDAGNESADADGPPADVPAGDDAADQRGPASTLPEQVPDHVTEIHSLIGQFLDGTLDGSLGDAVSGATPADGGQSENAADGGA